MSSKAIRPYMLGRLLDQIDVVMQRTDLYRSCITCAYFEGARDLSDHPAKQPRCAKHCAHPPAFIIANGCDDYVDMVESGKLNDDIPF